MRQTTKEAMAQFAEHCAKALDFGRKGTGDLSDAELLPLVQEADAICATDASIENPFAPDDDVRLSTLRKRLTVVHEDIERLAKVQAGGKSLAPAQAFAERTAELEADAAALTDTIRRIEAEI